MAGLGFGSNTKITTPEGFTEGSISWANLALEQVQFMADFWFKDYGLAPIKDTLQPGAIDADPAVRTLWDMFAPFLAGEAEEASLAIPGLEIQLSDLGEQIDLSEGELGPALTKALDGAGITWWYDTRISINHFESADVPFLKTTGIAQWGTLFGLPMEQTFRVFRNAKGEETCLWSSNVLAATRAFEHLVSRDLRLSDTGEIYTMEIREESVEKGALTFGEWSSKIFIPHLAKSLFYLAETPFPSNVLAMAFGRNLAFGEEISPEKYPRPALINKAQSFARGAYDLSESGYLVSGTIMPHVVEMGWTFNTVVQSEIHKILEVLTDGLVRIASILEDGYLNYRTDEYPFPFDDTLLSAAKFDSDYVQGEDPLGWSCWVPVQRLGLLLNESNLRSDPALKLNSLPDQIWIASQGAGAMVPAVINSLVFLTLIPNEDWAYIDHLLDLSVRMDVVNQSTNSLSNWGIAKYKQGLVDEAVAKFESALERPDKYAEAEASYWLAEIHEKRGNQIQADSYRARCEEAGGYEALENREPVTSGLTKSSNTGLGNSTKAKSSGFCSQCGSEFKNEQARFCTNCGNAR